MWALLFYIIILAAEEHKIWSNTRIWVEPEHDCTTCKIATVQTAARNKRPHTPAGNPEETVFMDILPCKSQPSLTPCTSHDCCLMFFQVYGLFHNRVWCYISGGRHIQIHWHLQDTCKCQLWIYFQQLQNKMSKHKINLMMATPKCQDSNHLAECSWQMIHHMVHSMLVHNCLPDKYHFHAIRYAAELSYILPARNL